MKTRRFISKVRVATEIAALCIVALFAVLLFVYGEFTVQKTLFRFWPIGAGVLFTYTVLILTEDYLNDRILRHYPKLN